MEEALVKRVLPHSVEAEQSVIGAMLMDRDAITIASEILTVDDFYQKQYGILFEPMSFTSASTASCSRPWWSCSTKASRWIW